MLCIFSNAACIGTSKNWKPITHMSGEKSIVALPNYGHNRAAYYNSTLKKWILYDNQKTTSAKTAGTSEDLAYAIRDTVLVDILLIP